MRELRLKPPFVKRIKGCPAESTATQAWSLSLNKEDSMLDGGAIKHALNECQLSREQNELWDGEPDMYINQGWIEALEYVLTINKSQRFFVKVNFDIIKEKLYGQERET